MPVEHDHDPIQNRDGKPPWCRVCGLTANFETPKPRFSSPPVKAQMIPSVLSTDDLAKKWFDEDEQDARDYIGAVYDITRWEDAPLTLKQKYIRRVQEARR
jgi:hypothetical protein